MSIFKKENIVIAAKAAIVGIAALGLGMGTKALVTKKTGLPEGYEDSIIENNEEESTEE